MRAELGQARLVLVTGKGGVGKTAVAAALGRALSAAGQRVLVCELSPMPTLQDVMGVAKLGHQARTVDAGLSAASLGAREAVEEYLVEVIPAKRMVRAVLGNRAAAAFIDSTPAAGEFAFANSIYQRASDPSYDRVVVDMPATGHAVFLLTVSRLLAEVARVGPLARRGEEIDAMLTNPELTRVVPVTTAEELPVNETLELVAKLRDKARVKIAGVVANMVPPAPPTGELPDGVDALDPRVETMLRWLQMGQRHHEGAAAELKRLQDSLRGDLPVLSLEQQYAHRDARELGLALAEELAGQLAYAGDGNDGGAG